jgi:hypothetical protein
MGAARCAWRDEQFRKTAAAEVNIHPLQVYTGRREDEIPPLGFVGILMF